MDQREKPSLHQEFGNVEKQLRIVIQKKGVLNSDAQDLYRKACSSYEEIILGNHELRELQEVEYSMWDLIHYIYIDECRKGMTKTTTNEDNDSHVEWFKSFLLEASEFYRNLIAKIKKVNGLPEDCSLCRLPGDSSDSAEGKKVQKIRFLCHRFLVCLGDLARYRERHEKSELQNHNWSFAVSHYLEASMIWPDSGNPQHQLAFLAMYVSDEFLALYHFIRSLAVKEPFPRAQNNLVLLCENNLKPSDNTDIDMLKPKEDSSNCSMEKAEQERTKGTNLWSLVIKLAGLFLVESRYYSKLVFEDFPRTFASVLRELDSLLELNDEELKASLDSYRIMGAARGGPFRTLQIVAIFIFVIDNLTNNRDLNEPQRAVLLQLASTSTFAFMGHLVDRCLKAKSVDSCPLLPALLIFLEWLQCFIDKVETYLSDEKNTGAISNFLARLVELLKRFDIGSGERESKLECSVALWEDYELRGFLPLAHIHLPLDFSNHWENADSSSSGTKSRVCRIISAARKLAEKPKNNGNWILYDKSVGSFYMSELGNEESTSRVEKCEKPSAPEVLGKPVNVEDEEIILFKPLTRYNSAPPNAMFSSEDHTLPRDKGDQTLPADECLRRATSLLIAQNLAHGDHSTFQSDLTNFRRNKVLPEQDPLPSSEPSTSLGSPTARSAVNAGPPSLNAWVLDGESFSLKRKAGTSKPSLAPIEELASGSFEDLSINEMAKSVVSSCSNVAVPSQHHSPAYTAPTPSAPFLPDTAVWSNNTQPTVPPYRTSTISNMPNGFFNMPHVSSMANPYGYGLADNSTPTRRLTSAEWLRQFRETHYIQQPTSYAWPLNSYNMTNSGANFPGVFDHWQTPPSPSTPLIYGNNPPLHHGFDNGYNGYQRPSSYLADGPEPLLQYLKNREWLVKQDHGALRGPPAYM